MRPAGWLRTVRLASLRTVDDESRRVRRLTEAQRWTVLSFRHDMGYDPRRLREPDGARPHFVRDGKPAWIFALRGRLPRKQD